MNGANQVNCLLCKCGVRKHEESMDWAYYDCQRCGAYAVAGDMELFEPVLREYEGRMHLLSGCIRELRAHGNRVKLTRENIKDLLALAPQTVLQKADRLLRTLAQMTETPGKAVRVNRQNDLALGYCKNQEELAFYLENLQARRLIDRSQTQADIDCILTGDGWNAVETQRKSNLTSDKAFVAMWFDPALTPIYEGGIKPAINDAGYRSVRIDAEEYNSDVVERFLAEIRESRFLVADVTGKRNGVYFEGGFGMGLALPVIWMCRHDQVDDLHFDTEHLNHIVWKDAADLRERLTRRILATIGRGTYTVPK